MKWESFRAGIEILDAYIDDETYSGAHAEHDQFWAGPGSVDRISDEDRDKLLALDWFEDEESWSCFV